MFHWWKAWRDLLWPKTCLACSRPLIGSDDDTLLCLRCLDSIKVEPGMRQSRDFKTAAAFDRFFFACRYSGAVKKLIHRFKYDDRQYLASFFGRLLEESIRTLAVPMEKVDAVVAVPLHASRLREREYNQAHLLAEYIGRVFCRPVEEALLVRSRLTRTQTDLSPQERHTNVAGCFSAASGRPLNGKTLLLVDDVLTTGATASEASKALKAAGAETVYVLTVAH